MEAGVGRCSNGDLGAVREGATAVNGTHQWVLRFHDNGVEGRNRLEISSERGVLLQLERARVGGEAVIPFGENGIFVRNCIDLDDASFRIATTTGYGAQSGVVGKHVDRVIGRAVLVELGSERLVFVYDDPAGIGGDAIVPADEDVIRVGAGIQEDGVAIVVSASATDGSALFRVAGGTDFVGYHAKLGDIGGIAFHQNVAWVFDGAVGPMLENIARIAVGGQFDDGAVIIRAGPVDATGAFGGHVGLDEALLDPEMCRIDVVFRDDDGARIVGDVIGPAHKLKSQIGRGGHHYGVVVIIDAAPRHGTPVHVVGQCGDGVLANAKRGGEGAVLGDDDLARVGVAAIVPAFELEAGVGCGLKREGVAVMVGAAATDGTAVFGCCRGLNEVIEETEMCDKSAVLGNNDVAWVFGDAVVPVKEFGTHDGEGRDGGRVAVEVGAAAFHGAPTRAVGHDGEGVVGANSWDDGKSHNFVATFRLIEDLAVFPNGGCAIDFASIINAKLVDDQVKNITFVGKGVAIEHFTVLPNDQGVVEVASEVNATVEDCQSLKPCLIVHAADTENDGAVLP